MGVSFSCPFALDSDVESGLESVIVKSINFTDDGTKTPVGSGSFSSRGTERMITNSTDDEVKRLMNFKGRELEKMDSYKDSSSHQNYNMERQFSISDSSMETVQDLAIVDPSSPKHEAATKLQKVYKSFRTRRRLADCAVLVEQCWWKLLDFAELKRSSISFFDIEKHETAISRWSRARTRAAKVGKGLSKNDKAQKLALQHWLEAIDPRHRYGHNLHFYYKKWLQCQSREPFFYWLDIGEGKEVILERCPRSKLQQQCIKYLGPMERKAYEVVVKDGLFFSKQTGEILNTAVESKDKWIFVLSTSKSLYVGKKKKGTFQHSSFLAGGATMAAGRLIVENGILKTVWPHSGHYRPTEENFRDFLSFLRENNVDLSDVKMSPADEDEESLSKQRTSNHIRSNSSEEDGNEKLIGSESEETHVEDSIQENTDLTERKANFAVEPSQSRRLCNFSKKLSHLEIPKTKGLYERQGSENQPGFNSLLIPSPVVNCETAVTSACEEADSEVVIIREEAVLQRINSHKEMKSYQLGKQLSCKWTTGAGPRIGCVRDYPPELQFEALEQVSLSPRSGRRSRSGSSSQSTVNLSSNILTPTSSR